MSFLPKFVRYDSNEETGFRGFAIEPGNRYPGQLSTIFSVLREKGILLQVGIGSLLATLAYRTEAAYKKPPRPATLTVWLGQKRLI